MLFNASLRDRRLRRARGRDEYRQLEGRVRRRRSSGAARPRSQWRTRRRRTTQSARDRFRAATSEVQNIRARAADLVADVTAAPGYTDSVGDTPKPDVNYVFPTFVTTRLPPGLVGLIIAAIFAAAMSATAGELSATASATIIDIYRRLLRPGQSDAHYLLASRVATAFWGTVACVVAHFAVQLGSLIEVVNRFGSIFYGRCSACSSWRSGSGARTGPVRSSA